MDRAEARRRARYAAQGRDLDELESDEEEAAQPERATAAPRPSGTLLQRLFPSPPPLPGKGNPLAGFRYEGRFRPLVEALYLLRSHPLPWLTGGLIWAVGRIFSNNSMSGILASLVSFTALIGAGWVGWWRPWLAGLAASIVGWIVFIGLLGALTVTGGTATPSPVASGSVVALPSGSAVASATAVPSASAASAEPSASTAPGVADQSPPAAGDVAISLGFQTAIQLALGIGAGWYGGYLRRRMVASTPQRRPPPRRR
jgi:hypothetical protein